MRKAITPSLSFPTGSALTHALGSRADASTDANVGTDCALDLIGPIADPLIQVLRRGARELLVAAVEAEAAQRIYAQKTGKKRVVPILGRLMELLTLIRARDQASVGTVLMLSTNNLRREFHKLFKRARLEPWEDCFQVLRRNCETDWSQQFPQHVVSTWVGHSIIVSARHYLQVPEEVYKRARTMR